MRIDRLLSTEPGGQRLMLKGLPIISAFPEIMGGTPVFAGTRVPVQTLLDYLVSLRSACSRLLGILAALN